MKWILRINGTIESLVGLILFMRPDVLFSDGENNIKAILSVKMYGILAMSFGILSLIIGKHATEEKLIHYCVLMVIVFHLLIAFQSYGAYLGGYLTNPGAFGFHLFLALFFVVLFLKNKK